MSKSVKKNSRKRSNQAGLTSLRNVTSRMLSQSVSVIPFRGIPFVVTQGTSGNGGISNENSGSSLSNANLVNIDPFNFGARMSLIADQFLEYRFKALKFIYVPRYTASGVAPTPGGATGSPSYADRNFVWGVVDDPALLGSLNFQTFVEYGGLVTNSTRRSQLVIKGGTLNRWRYTSTTASTPTAIDLRMVAPVQLRFYFDDTSITAAATYGYIMYEAVVEFRGAANNAAVIGLAAVSQPAATVVSNPSDEKKETTVKGWFTK